MAATKSRAAASRNGAGAAGTKVREAGGAVASTAREARVPLIAAGATAAGLAGGLALGRRIGPKRSGPTALIAAAQVLRKVSHTADDVHQIRQQLERANRRSPIEVVLEGLTHRRGAHRLEG